MGVNHVIACGWYAIAKNNDEGWLSHFRVEGLTNTYWTSYHWSLTQFSGTMEVFPTNSVERIFSVLTLLFAFIVTSWVVSSITSSMTRLEIATARESEKLSKLTRYLFDNRISRAISLRVQRSVRSSMAEQQRN